MNIDYQATKVEPPTFDGYLAEGLYLLELLFEKIDVDGSGFIQFEELVRYLATKNFSDGQRLKNAFEQVDLDRSEALEFGEFFALIFIWAQSSPNELQIFFPNPTNKEVFEQTVKSFYEEMTSFGTDKSSRLPFSEVRAFFAAKLPSYLEGGNLEATCNEIFPNQPEDLSLVAVGLLLYAVLARSGRTRLRGKYAHG
eukprot:CAMPEP_0113695362 /NCGR_PEP_ID=MMETSP0038_2-20120614/20859_1 /TAXON_ID=2898 /ORGANISM="Cryptomonas paramecium" /LENGTH=196 /DNA_ID=CAMNT_0000617899 /DNA_START=16 /DNA_END=602 /DNA_ORIENTATION=- /assembly_acc=CAM_ASM_000170